MINFTLEGAESAERSYTSTTRNRMGVQTMDIAEEDMKKSNLLCAFSPLPSRVLTQTLVRTIPITLWCLR